MRHHAVGAGVIAAFDDSQIGAKRIVAPRDIGFESFVGIEIETHHAAAARFDLGDKFGQLAVACRSADETDPRRALENVFAFLLRQASEHADDFICSRLPRHSPRREKTFCAAFSRMLHVLYSMRSASAGFSAAV